MGSIRKYIYEPTKYGFSSGQVRVIEKHLLTKHMIERLVDARDFSSKLHILSETIYSHFFHDVDTIDKLEHAFENALQETYDTLVKINENPLIVDFFKLKYDYQNLKVILKEQLLGTTDADLIMLGKHKPSLLKKAIKNSNFSIVGIEFDKTVTKVKEIFKKTENPSVIDTIVDHRYFDHLLSLAKQLKSKHLVSVVRTMMDLANVKTVSRHIYLVQESKIPQNHLVTGGFIKAEDIQKVSDSNKNFFVFLKDSRYKAITEKLENGESIDKLSDDFMLELNRDIKYEIAGIEILAAYFLAREYEIKTLRLIMISSLREISRETVKKRILSIYG